MNKILLVITGEYLSIDNIIDVSRNNMKVKLSQDVQAKVNEGYLQLKTAIQKADSIYGISTGVGALKDIPISPENKEEYQKNLLLSHAVGTGTYFGQDVIRAAILLKINSLVKGYSGVRLLVIDALVALLNFNILPAVPQKGSVGASGDLVPLSHIALVLIGEGNVFLNGELVKSEVALRHFGLKPISLIEKEGLSLINGTEIMTAIAALVCFDADVLMKTADIAGALSFEVLNGVINEYDLKAMSVRPHSGQKIVAKNLLSLLKHSALDNKTPLLIQDAYSLRCIPQVHGASRDALSHVINIINTEINSVTDNPVIIDGIAYSNGNFHGQPVGLVMDYLKIALSEIGSISERRINRILDTNLSHLVPFLSFNTQLSSGLMIVQYSAAALVSENKVLAHPACVDSIPLSANQEDHVSMGTIAARQAYEIIENIQNVIARELFVSINGIEYNQHKLGEGTRIAYEYLREISPVISEERFYFQDIKRIAEVVGSGKLLCVVQRKIEIN